MAVARGTALALCLWTLLGFCASAPPSRDLFEISNEPSTSTELTLGKQDPGNSIWEEDDDVFDLDGDSWLDQPSAPLSQWSPSNQSPNSPDFDEEDEDNIIDDESDDNDEDEGEEPDADENPSEFLLVPAASVDKRDLKVRHTGRSSDGELDDSNFLERPDDPEQDREENYDLVSFPEAEDEENPQPEEDNNEADNDLDEGNDNDIFGEEDDDDSKRMFEDRVFLF